VNGVSTSFLARIPSSLARGPVYGRDNHYSYARQYDQRKADHPDAREGSSNQYNKEQTGKL
jgi:hypothetical protein